MELRRIRQKELLASSTNQGVIFNKQYEFNNISFRVAELSYITKIYSQELYRSILKLLDNPKKASFGDFQSSEGMELFFKKMDNKILVISAGESQRGLHQIYIEGIWQIFIE